MNKRCVLSFAMLALTMPVAVAAQDRRPQQVLIQSWKKGRETVYDQTIRILLAPMQSEYTTEFSGKSGKRYKLNIIHSPLPTVKADHWKIELREIFSTSEGKEKLGDNLLVVERPGSGGDNFPREDIAAYFYPDVSQPVVRVAGTQFTEGYPFYPLMATRKIRVEGFYLIAKVEHYQFSKTDKNKLASLDLVVKLLDAVE